MRTSPLLLALPALATAQQQIPFLDQVKGWFAAASSSISSAAPSAPSASIPDPIASGAAKIADLKVERLTLENYKDLLKPGAAIASPGIEEWMVFVTGGNKTCFGRCGKAETAWNESVPLISTSSTPPSLAMLDCETDGVLCNAWAMSPPSVIHMLLPQPLPDQSTPATTVRSINLNMTSVTATEIAAIHNQEAYKDVAPYEGFWHPFDGPLAKAGLAIPAGYAIWGFSKIPSWAFMIGVSFLSRNIMHRDVLENACRYDREDVEEDTILSGCTSDIGLLVLSRFVYIKSEEGAFEPCQELEDENADEDQEQDARKGDIVTRLPKELQLDIFDRLAYRDAIRLAQANRYLHATIDPQTWPTGEEEDFIHKAQSWPKHNHFVRLQCKRKVFTTLADGYACFSCYRVRPKSAFSQKQSARNQAKSSGRYGEIGHTRFCLDCGIKNFFYKPGAIVKVVMGEDMIVQGGLCEKYLDAGLRMSCGTCRAFTAYKELEAHVQCHDCYDWPFDERSEWLYSRGEWHRSAEVHPIVLSKLTQLQCNECGNFEEMRHPLRCGRCERRVCGVCLGAQESIDAPGAYGPCNGSCTLVAPQPWEDAAQASIDANQRRLERKAGRAQALTEAWEESTESMLQGLGI
ncbi:hypothetical protein LTR85_007655 [Meristemomyces frigidus]|nr:hypothetical protein LTR85_007655 [Meristemomyces frigidus]